MTYYLTQEGREFLQEAGVGKTMRAAISSGEQQTATQPGRGGPLARRAKVAQKMQAFKPRQGTSLSRPQGVPAEGNPAFGRATSRPETVPGRRAARRAVARTAGQPEEVRRAAGHAAMGRG